MKHKTNTTPTTRYLFDYSSKESRWTTQIRFVLGKVDSAGSTGTILVEVRREISLQDEYKD